MRDCDQAPLWAGAPFPEWGGPEIRAECPGFPYAVFHADGEFKMMTVAWRKVASRLRYADDRLAGLKLGACETEVEVALEIEGSHTGIGRIVEPKSTP
jgi:hypothetical protein